jgi:hypothetical protein
MSGSKDWRRVVGMFGDSGLMREVDEVSPRMRDADRARPREAGTSRMIMINTRAWPAL